MDNRTQDLISYIKASPSPFHCVEESAKRLRAAGFSEIDEHLAPEDLSPGDQAFICRSGSILAFRVGRTSPCDAGFRILGAHTDSPNLRLKPRPDLRRHGYAQWGVEKYGGLLLSTWLDRDLGVSGRVFVRDASGRPVPKLFRKDEPIARIPNLAIHLEREVNTAGLVIDPENHLPPMMGMESLPKFEEWLEAELGAEVVSWDLGLMDVVDPCVGGIDKSFLFSPRLDNQACCYASIEALIAASGADVTQVAVLFDHEEIGSRSQSGAMGAFLGDVLRRIERDSTEKSRGGLERAIANSCLISLDMAHGIHPNYSSKHESRHAPVLNGGPVIKEHVEQRYATDAQTMAWFRDLCRDVDVPVQDFVIKQNLACGSTIGPISAGELGVKTVDVGNAMLSMHSIREQCGVEDTDHLLKVLRHALQGA